MQSAETVAAKRIERRMLRKELDEIRAVQRHKWLAHIRISHCGFTVRFFGQLRFLRAIHLSDQLLAVLVLSVLCDSSTCSIIIFERPTDVVNLFEATNKTQCAKAEMETGLRIGLGHDTHRIDAGGPLRLGGIDIDFDGHLVGHSDADVLLHAITDAILGAANLGDIGEMFPDTDAANYRRDSADMLRQAWERVQRNGWRIVNIDCVVLAERPKLLPHRESICKRIAEILNIDRGQVGLKGKTGEKSGEIGHGKIMQAMCICLLTR